MLDKQKELKMMRDRSSSFSHLQSPKFKRKPTNMVLVAESHNLFGS